MTEFVVSAWDVVGLAAWMVVAVAVAVTIYRSMQRPRLRLDPTAGGARAPIRDVVLYALTAPLLVLAWYAFFVLILVVGTNDLSGDRILTMSMALVIASRLLAHAWHEAAHELAKTVPLTLVALVIIAGAVRSDTSLESISTQMGETGITGPALLLLLLSDYVITTVWYWLGVRVLSVRGYRVPGVPAEPVAE